MMYNGLTVDNVVYNAQEVCKVVYNGILVWERNDTPPEGDVFPVDDATHKYLNPNGTLFSLWTDSCRALTEATKDDWSGLVSWCSGLKYGNAGNYLTDLYSDGYVLGTPVRANDHTYDTNIYGATNRTLVGIIIISNYGTYNKGGSANYVAADGNRRCRYGYSTGYGRDSGDMYIPIYSN